MIGRTSSTISLPSIRWLVSEAKHEKKDGRVSSIFFWHLWYYHRIEPFFHKLVVFLAAMPLKNNHVCSEAAGFVSQHSQ